MCNGSPADPGLPDVTSAPVDSALSPAVAGPAHAPDAMTDPVPPWVHQPGESAAAFAAGQNSSQPPVVAGLADVPDLEKHHKPPWERQPGETPKAFEAAQNYFQHGANRSLTQAGKQIQRDRSLVGRWSRKWRWVERAAAYDEHMARVEQEAREKERAAQGILWEKRRDELRERAWSTAESLFSIVDGELKYLVANPRDMRMTELLRVLDRAHELARFAAGVPRARLVPGDPWDQGPPARDAGGETGSRNDGPPAAVGSAEEGTPPGDRR